MESSTRSAGRAPRPRRAAIVLAVVVPLVVAALAARGSTVRSPLAGGAASPAPISVDLVRRAATPLRGAPADYDALMARVGDAEVVLLGESTHGTHEFYRERARITRRLVEEKGFGAVAIEAEWADARRVDLWLQGRGGDRTADEALRAFHRFPRWMWANAEMRELVGWLRGRRPGGTAGRRHVGFYGLDVQSPQGSIDEVLAYLRRADPAAARRGAERYRCLESFREAPETYASLAPAAAALCRRGVGEQLRELSQRQRTDAADRAGADDRFSAVQSARVVRDAEILFGRPTEGQPSYWNVRDRHMADTLDEIHRQLAREGRPPRVVVWAHNTHVGDASATSLGEGGDWSVGQLMRERRGRNAVLVGFSTYAGTVLAARDWGEEGRRHDLRPAQPGSDAEAFHRAGLRDFVLPLPRAGRLADELSERRPHRAVGVVYRPESEQMSHYLEARPARQFDAIVHLDRTRAVTPLPAPARE